MRQIGPFTGDRAGRARQIPCRAPGQKVSQIEELPCRREDLWPVFEEPQQLRRFHFRRDLAADKLQHLVARGVDAFRLLHGAMVHPHDDVAPGLLGRAHGQRLTAFAQHDERAGCIEADAVDLIGRHRGLRQRVLHGMADGVPDFTARLLDDGAARVEQRDVMFCRGHHVAGKVENAGPGAARANVHADDIARIARAGCRAGGRFAEVIDRRCLEESRDRGWSRCAAASA